MQKKYITNGKKLNEKSMKGFTLIEVVIAVSIISVGFFGVYSLHLQTIRANSAVRFHLKAPLLAEMKISEIDSGLGSLTESSGDFGDVNSGYLWKVTPGEIETEESGSVAEKLIKYDLDVFNEGSSYGITVYRFFNQSEK